MQKLPFVSVLLYLCLLPDLLPLALMHIARYELDRTFNSVLGIAPGLGVVAVVKLLAEPAYILSQRIKVGVVVFVRMVFDFYGGYELPLSKKAKPTLSRCDRWEALQTVCR